MSAADDRDQAEPATQPQMPDLEAVYDQQISPLMAQIVDICVKHEMPFVAGFQFSGTGFCVSARATAASDKRISMAVSVLRHGFLAFMATMPSPDPPSGGSTH